MALPFSQTRKKQQYLHWVLLIAVLIGAIWFGRNYLVKPLPPPPSPPKEKKIEINLKILDNPFLQELQLFEEIMLFEREIGRDNPFLPYGALPSPPPEFLPSEPEVEPEPEPEPEPEARIE